MKTIDAHVHAYGNDPGILLSHLERYDYSHICLVGCPGARNPINNIQLMYSKMYAPKRIFAYGGICTLPGVFESTGEGNKKQLEMLVAAGFDGWKIIETKPAAYKNLQIPLDGPVYEPAFAYAEEIGLPIIWHAGDPATFWDPTTAPADYIAKGWVYNTPEHPTLQECYRQVETVLARHPKLKVSLAHLLFLSDNPDYAFQLMDRYPHLNLDICPGFEMYQNFVKEPHIWREFFTKYQDRLIYGTDRRDNSDDVTYGYYDGTYNYIIRALFEDKPLDRDGVKGVGCGVPWEVHDKLFAGNFIRLNGTQPKALNKEAMAVYADWLAQYLDDNWKAQLDKYMLTLR